MLKLSKQVPILERPVEDKSLKFWSTDSAELFKLNSKNPRWRWHNTQIDYNFNSWGYRTVEYSSLGKDFILTLGCSETEGIGLPEHMRWSNLLAQQLGCDLYCGGLLGQGADTVARQSVLWSTRLRLPRAVYIQWPNATRKTFATLAQPLRSRREYVNIKKTPIYFAPVAHNDRSNIDSNWFVNRYTAEQGELVINNWQNIVLADLAWRAVGVPVIHFTWDTINGKYLDFCTVDVKNLHDKIEGKNLDLARDGWVGHGHRGPRFNSRIAQYLLDFTFS